jgi:trk system potassium uptake protein TrkA
MESIVILGATPSSEALVQQLLKLNISITLIDDEQEKLSYFDDKYDVVTIQGHASHPTTLSNTLNQNTSFFIAMSDSDETNLLACQIAKSLYATRSICCINDPSYVSDTYKPHVDHLILINQSLVSEFTDLILYPEFIFNSTVHQSYLATILKIDKQHTYFGHTLDELHQQLPNESIIAGLYRQGSWASYHGNIKLTENDWLLVVCKKQHLALFSQHAKSKSITILGAGATATAFCDELSNQLNITVIDQHKDRCESLIEQHTNLTVIHDDPQDIDAIQPYISHSQATLALSPDDENNLVYMFGALDAGASNTFNLINHIKAGHIFATSPISHIIAKPQVICDHIFRDILSHMHTHFFHTKQGLIQIATIYINEEHPYANQKLGDLSLNKGVIIGCIFRDDQAIFTRKDLTIMPHDQILMYAPHCVGTLNPLEVQIT